MKKKEHTGGTPFVIRNDSSFGDYIILTKKLKSPGEISFPELVIVECENKMGRKMLMVEAESVNKKHLMVIEEHGKTIPLNEIKGVYMMGEKYEFEELKKVVERDRYVLVVDCNEKYVTNYSVPIAFDLEDTTCLKRMWESYM